MKINFSGKEFKIWVILSVIIILLWSVVMIGIFGNRRNSKEVYLENEVNRLEGEVNSILLTYSNFSDYIFEEINKDEEIKHIMQQANSASIEEKEALRENLYNKVYDKYLSMKKYEYRQLHFHLPNTESFLRVHAPDKYGDSLLEIRESVCITNESLEKTICFEEGKVFNGFRYVYPLFNNNNHIGSVELSISSKSIIEILSELYPREDFYFIIDKEVVKQKLFEEELSNYEDIAILEEYYVDKEVMEATRLHNTVVPIYEETFFKNLINKNSGKIKNRQAFSAIYRYNGKNYTAAFLTIENINKAPIAYLISIKESIGVEGFTQNTYEQVILVTLLVIIIILFGLLLAYYNLKLKKVSEKDFLTNIYNRNKFYELAKKEEKFTKRYKYESSVLLLDIDHFKRINDKYGHGWGDQVLKKLASEISKNIRETDIFARWGGEEFVLLLPHTNKSGALKAAEKIRKIIGESQTKELKEITISIGVSKIDSENYDIDKAIMLADKAMYCAKENGRNQVCYK